MYMHSYSCTHMQFVILHKLDHILYTVLSWMLLFFFLTLPFLLFSFPPTSPSSGTPCWIFFCMFFHSHGIIYKQLCNIPWYRCTIHFQPPNYSWTFICFQFFGTIIVLLFLWYRYPELKLLGINEYVHF